MAAHGAIKPGHNVIVRGGVYDIGTRNLNVTIAGTSTRPVTISNYPGETVELRFQITQVGSYVIYTSEDYGWLRRDILTTRVNESGTAAPVTQANALYCPGATNVQVRNWRVENIVGTGFSWHTEGDRLLYGCVIHNSGWVGTDGGHGPPFYGANPDPNGHPILRNLVCLNNFRGVQIGEGNWEGDEALNYTVEDVTSNSPFGTGGTRSDNAVFRRIFLAQIPPTFGVYIADDDENGSIDVRDCVIDSVDFPNAFTLYKYAQATIQDNIFTVGSYTNTPLDDGVYDIQTVTATTSGQYVNLVPNTYAPRFATLSVFDFDEVGSINVDISAFAESGTVRVRNPMLWDEYLDLTVTDGAITLPMTGWTTPLPTGFDDFLGYITVVFTARFGAFILEKDF